VEQYNIESRVNFRQALEKIHIIIIIIIIITGEIVGLILIGCRNAYSTPVYSTLLLLAKDSLSKGHILITERAQSCHPASVTKVGARNLPFRVLVTVPNSFK
jgi:hypothetical protein